MTDILSIPDELTDVEKAMEWIDDYSCLSVYMSGEYSAHMRKHLTRGIHDTIMTALHAQSETERKIEKVRERCKLVMEIRKDFNSDYIEAKHILGILEGEE